MASPNVKLKSSHFKLPLIIKQLLETARIYYLDNNTLSAEIYQSLNGIFGETFVKATNLIDSNKVIEYKTQSGLRSSFKVQSDDDYYALFNNVNFCQCIVFEENVIVAQNKFTCEHVLALKLAQITNKLHVEIVSNSQLTDLLTFQFSFYQDD